MSYTRQSILFISGLEKTVNENMLYQLFNEFPISYIKIAKDHQTRESFGYAFVGFKNHGKAEEAIMKLNYSRLGKKSIRISWYNREPNNYRNDPEYNIFVKKISKTVTQREFHDYFSKFGNIVSAKLVEDEEGEIVGYGFVLYDNRESAAMAISETNGVEWKGKRLYVGQFIKNRPRKLVMFNNIYVKNIPLDWSQEQVEAFFGQYGELGSVLLRRPDGSNLDKLAEPKRNEILSHQYAFVCFNDKKNDNEFHAAKRAVNEVPYYKIHDMDFNAKLDRVIELITNSKIAIDHDRIHMAAAYVMENTPDDTQVFSNFQLLEETLTNFNKHLSENDNTYIVKDKSDRMECCQALKKKDRQKKLKQIYERIKRQIKEKYKFCNLYVKNLPDSIDDDGLKDLFGKFGEIRSAKTGRKELLTSYLGIKRSVKVFGYVCFFDALHAREAKASLNGQLLGNSKIFVDYHQSKQERAEYLKLKLMSQTNKMMQGKGTKPGMEMIPPMLRNLPMNVRTGANIFGPQLLRKFPQQTAFVNPMPVPQLSQPMMPQRNQMQQRPQIDNMMLDHNARRDYYGEQLYTKISSSPNFNHLSNYFSKIVGIFLDLDDKVLDRLLHDEAYFFNQVIETVRLLDEKTGN